MAFRRFGQLRAALCSGALIAGILSAWGCGNVKSASNIPETKSVVISVDPPSASVQTSKTLTFTASVQNSSNTAVTWQVNNTPGGDAAHGTISSDGVYTAPTAVPSPATVTVTAIAQAEPTALDTAQVTVMSSAQEIALSVTPTGSSVQVREDAEPDGHGAARHAE